MSSEVINRPPEYRIDIRPLIEIPFWRLEGYEVVVPEESSPERRPISAVPVVWRNRPDAPPASACSRLGANCPRLRAALTLPREGREIDVDRIVRR
ncbi:MAG: hypothetical protein R3F40_07200 [Candidatus Competibacteraceae bacterium]